MVTAAWSPVGRAAAARLAQRGDLVLMGARRPDHCERLASRLRGQGATAFAGYLDLADTVSIDRFVESARYLIGEVDVLITDAGLCAAEAHVVGAQHLAAQLIPPMIRHGHGDVVLVSPDLVAGTKPPRTAVSAASRQALDVWVSGLDAEFVGTGVRASLVRSAWPAAGWRLTMWHVSSLRCWPRTNACTCGLSRSSRIGRGGARQGARSSLTVAGLAVNMTCEYGVNCETCSASCYLVHPGRIW
ncbi:short chain dehydrogenase family protein [Mycobacterium xenopi 3993]|nr:short chain dehydrogenase family protein [Mycobacterium xenopi 3993]